MIRNPDDIVEPKGWNVRKDYRNKGVSMHLASLVRKRLKEMGVKEIYIEALNSKANMTLYEKMGFRKTEFPYNNPFDDITVAMIRKL